MQGINVLVREHENVLNFSDKVKDECIKIFNGKELNTEFFEKVLDFGRNFVDKHHHKKEDDILFITMIDKLEEPIKHVIEKGMLFDHDTDRMFLMNLEYAIQEYKMISDDNNKLKIISSAFGYADLINNHINKENKVLYPYAETNLKLEDQENVNNKIQEYEEQAYSNNIQSKYLELLTEIKNM